MFVCQEAELTLSSLIVCVTCSLLLTGVLRYANSEVISLPVDNSNFFALLTLVNYVYR